MKGIRSCCRGCEDRHLACHDHCERYQEAHEEWIEFNRKTKANKRMYVAYEEYRINALAKYNRKK